VKGYAVIDFETTGTKWHRDRILEVGLVLLSKDLEVEEEFETLVDANRDVGPAFIHGIESRWLFGAPRFEEVAAMFVEKLGERVVVGHNAGFDLHFMESEFRRLDADFRYEWVTGENLILGSTCTKRLSRHVFGSRAQSLGWLASQFDLENPNAHAALEDAKITADVFSKMMVLSREVREEVSSAGMPRHPNLDRGQSCALKKRPAATFSTPGLASMIESSPPLGMGADLSDYISLIMRSLQDQNLSAFELNEIQELAKQQGLSRGEILNAHDLVLTYLASNFWADGVLSESERNFLSRSAELLDVHDFQPDELNDPMSHPSSFSINLFKNQTVLLTGFQPGEKAELSSLIDNLNLFLANSFSKKVNIVVARDPDTQSTKAKAARRAGVPVFGRAYLDFLVTKEATEGN
jgi:DNA polymerase-3 subunit epsilon